MQVSDFVMEQIAKEGVKHVFLIPGGGSMYLVDALGRHPDLQPVAMLHEQGASIAAEAYGQFSKNLGVVLVTTGPGGTNALTGVAAAFLDSTPLLVISGQVKTSDSAFGRGVRQLGFQEVDVVAMARPITKFATRVTQVSEVQAVIEMAIRTAKSGRPGPVWVDVPLDIQSASAFFDVRSGDENMNVEETRSPVAEEIAAALHAAERPVFLVGNGVRLAGAEDLFQDLVDLTGIPVLLTWKALDLLPSSHRQNAGRPGGIATRHANFAHQFCDVYVSVGARLDMGQTGYRPDNVAPYAKRFIIDIDPSELEKLNCSSSTLVCSDAADFLRSLYSECLQYKWEVDKNWPKVIADWKTRFPVSVPLSTGSGLTTYGVVEVLSEMMNENDVFVPGSSGACSEVAMQVFRNKPGQRVFNSEGLGPMGFGVPAPIGAWFVDQARLFYSIDGDGGFLMNSQELEVAKRFSMGICWVVLNNNGYKSIQISQDNYFEGRRVASDPASGLTLAPASRIAESFGVDSCQVESVRGLQDAIRRFQVSGAPLVVEAKIDPTFQTQLKVRSALDDSGRMTTTDLTYLFPECAEANSEITKWRTSLGRS